MHVVILIHIHSDKICNILYSIERTLNLIRLIRGTSLIRLCHLSSKTKQCHHGRNFVAESGGDDLRIFSRASRKLLYRAIFSPNVFPGMRLLNWAYQKNQIQDQKVGGTKHSMSPGGKKVGGTCPPRPPPNYAHGIIYPGKSKVLFCLQHQF